MNSIKTKVIFSLFAVMVFVSVKAAAATLTYVNTFSTAADLTDKQNVKLNVQCRDDQFTRVNSPDGVGGQVARIFQEVDKTCLEPWSSPEYKHRTLVLPRDNANAENTKFVNGVETWAGWSMYVPSGSPFVTSPYGSIVFQVHGAQGAPEFHWRLVNGDLVMEASNSFFSKQNTVVFKTSYKPYVGQWSHFILRYKRSAGSDGITEVYMNGTKVYSRMGPNAYDISVPSVTFHAGIYWGTEVRTGVGDFLLYLDNIRIAKGTNGKDLVDPSGGGTPTPAKPKTPGDFTGKVQSN